MASLTLRVLTRSGDTTKNAPLTNAEIDQNFINIDADLALLAPLASPSFTGSVTTTSSLGFAVGAGGSVSQVTSRTTGVTLNKSSGAITLVSAAGSTTWQSFVVTNSMVNATDVPIVIQRSGTDLYEILVTLVTNGSFQITYRTTGGTTTETPLFNFVVLKGVVS